MQWHLEVGIFKARWKVRFPTKTSLRANDTLSFLQSRHSFCLFLGMSYECGNIEPNTGPRKRNTCCNVSICNGNAYSITAHNFEKVDLLEACNTVKKKKKLFIRIVS